MKTKLFTLLLAVVASVGTMFAWDYERVQIDDLYYNLDATTKTAEVTYQLQWDANNYSGLTTAIIPASVTYNSVIYSVKSIGGYAFYECTGLTSVTIPNSVTSIGDRAFEGCTGLTSIIVESGNTIYDSRQNCNAIIETATNTLIVGSANTVIPDNVTSIGDFAVYGCGLTGELVIPNSVTSIGREAFSCCSGLTSVTIGNSVTSIVNQAFYHCTGLTSVTIEAETPPTLGYQTFGWGTNCPFYVPCGTLDTYKTAWSDYASRIKYAPLPYKISTQAENGSISITSMENYTICDEQPYYYTLTVVPNYGYHFAQWSDGNTDNPRTIVLTQDTTFTAEFAKNTYTITTQSNNPEWGTTAGDTAALYLDTVSISAIPNYGYHFVKWDGDDIIDNSITVATAISIASELPTNSESDIYTIVGYVVGKYNYYDNLLYKIADTPNGGNTFLIYTGSQSVSIGDYISITGHIYKSSDLQYAYGDTQQVSFIKITNNLYNVVVKKNATYEAVFAKNVYSITKNAEHGSISGNSSAEYLDFVTLTVTPDYGYHFTQWSDGNTDNPRVFQITKDTAFTAEFAYDRVGTCGKDLALVWSYDPTNKVLTIGNAGSFTENMQFGVEAPGEMEELVIGNSVTAIGENAFAGISTLKKVTIGESVKTIHNNAFYNCVNLETIFNYRQTPTNAYSTAFDGVDKFECKLYVLPSSIDMYKAAAVWRDFYYTYAIGAEETTVTTNDVTVEPQDNAATVTWPTNDNAASYTIQITKDGVVFCTLIFNANGQLTGIAFAPSRDGQAHAPAAIMTANGLQFTVTGLDSATQYGYNLTAKDANDQTVATYSGSFTTTSEGTATGVEDVQGNNVQCTKVVRNGQIFILRGEKVYTITGQEVR